MARTRPPLPTSITTIYLPSISSVYLLVSSYALPSASSMSTSLLAARASSLCFSSRNLASTNRGSFGCSRASMVIPSLSAGATFSFKNFLTGAPPGGTCFGATAGAGDG